jgi:hypothetical protein
MQEIAIFIIIILFLAALVFGIYNISNNNILLGGVSLFISFLIVLAPFLKIYIFKKLQDNNQDNS